MGSALVVLVPLSGAVVLWFLRKQPARVHWASSVGLVALHSVVLLLWGRRMPDAFILSTWEPERLFQAQLHLRLSPESWAFALGAGILLLSIYLAAPTRPGSSNVRTRVISLAFIGLGTAGMLASNVVTVALAWAAADAFAFLVLLIEAENQQTVAGLTRRFIMQGVSALLVVAAAIPVRTGGAPIADDLPLRSTLIAAAVLFRVGLIPLQVDLPQLPGIRRGMGTLVRLLPPAMGLVVLARELPTLPAPPLRWSLLLLGTISAFSGGWRWYVSGRPVQARPFLVLCFAGLCVMAGSLGGVAGRSLITGLGVTLLLIGGLSSQWIPYQRWHQQILLPAALLMGGLPLLVLKWDPAVPVGGGGGFLSWTTLILISGGLALAIGGLLTLGREDLRDWPSGEPLVKVSYAAAHGALLLSALPVALVLGIELNLGKALLLAGTVGLGSLGAYLRGEATDRGDWVLGAGDWLPIGAVEMARSSGAGLLRGGATTVRGLARVFEGRAAMLWVYVFVLLMALLISPADV